MELKSRDNRSKELKRYGINKLADDYIDLENNYEDLYKEQQEFQGKLKEAIAEIRAKKGIARFFAALSLLWQLIATIEEGFKE